MVKIKAPKDFWAGLMFMGFGLGFLMVAQSYRMGTAIRMGPGYFPSVLGGMLAVLGLVVFAGSASTPEYFAQFIKSEMQKAEKVVRAANIKVD